MSLRKLRVLLEHLPPSSPVHRSFTDGQLWEWREELLWRLIRTQHDSASRIVHALGGRKGKPKLIKDTDWPRFPWVKPESEPERIGDAAGADGADVIAFLDTFD